jgi:H+-translocating NAD(P) transhydrogenase subunit alpha
VPPVCREKVIKSETVTRLTEEILLRIRSVLSLPNCAWSRPDDLQSQRTRSRYLRFNPSRAHANARVEERTWRTSILEEALMMDFISILSIFVLACFVGYYVVWSVTPALHTPLMSVTNAISSVIIVGALIAAAAAGSPSSKWLGLIAVALASVNIFGGFAVTARMLAMYKKKER